MSASKRRLGRGLEALLSGSLGDAASAGAELPDAAPADAPPIVELPLDALTPGAYQPRQNLSEEALAELAASIREQGVLQPLVVRPRRPSGETPEAAAYELVAGERRWRAARTAGLATVPVVVRDLDDQSALAVALIENLQREDLNPVEQARSLARLADEFALTHQQVADAVGRSRSSVTNLLRLLDLADEVKALLAEGRVDMGHARALLSLDAEGQVELARRADRLGWSVRQVERAIRAGRAAHESPAAATRDAELRWLERQIANALGRRVALRRNRDGTYRIDMAFGSLDELEDALGTVQDLVAQLRRAAGPRARGA